SQVRALPSPPMHLSVRAPWGISSAGQSACFASRRSSVRTRYAPPLYLCLFDLIIAPIRPETQMKNPINDEKGAALVVELVILAVVLAAAAFAGYQYMSHKSASNQATKPKPHVVASSASPTPSATSDNDLVVKAVRAYDSHSTNDAVTNVTIVGNNAKGN